MPHLLRVELVHSASVRGLEDLVGFATAPVARGLRAVSLTIGASTSELTLLAQGRHSLRLVLRPFERKEAVARFTDIDELA